LSGSVTALHSAAGSSSVRPCLLTRGGDADAPRPRRCHPRDSRGVGVVARAPEGWATAAACVPPCLIRGSTPYVVHKTSRNGHNEEDAYPIGVCGNAAAGCSTQLPSVTAATKGAQVKSGSGGSLGGGRLRLRCKGM
jgi:hypothetical protein